ncbi:MAG TPA: hypothetical protein VFX17_03355 [Patescibacteria group bacterium]|nr:hypothetical protein [Patescibacteria group bacterium]
MQLTQKARKGLAIGLSVSTVLMMGALGFVPAAFAAPHADGCLVSYSGTVWLISGGQRRGFTSAEVFQSSGYNFGQVQVASSEDIAMPVGPIEVYADGTLVKGPTDPLVYLVANGQKRGFTSGANFLGLGYSFANIQWAPTNTFQDLPTGANIDSATMAHPAGTLVSSSGTIWVMGASGRMGIPSMAVFNSYGYNLAHVVAANAADLAMPDQGAVTARNVCGSSTGNGSGSTGVSLSGPASQTFVAGQALADLGDFNFSGSATITSFTFERTGVSANDTLSNVYLFDGSTRLTDAASVTSDNHITFNGVNVTTPRTISVKSDIKTGTAGQTVGVKLDSYTAGSVTNVSVSGNLNTIATASLAAVSLGDGTGSGDTDPGTDINVWQSTAQVTVHDVLMTRLALREIGSIQTSDINNFKLYVDGTQVAQVQNLDSNGYVTFTMSKPLAVGARVLKVTADVIGGSGRSVQMSLRGAYDVSTTDTSFNVGVLATAATNFPIGPASFDINPGTLTVVKASDSQSSNVTVGASSQSLAKYTFTAFGEPVKVETLNLGVLTNDVTGTVGSDGVTLRNVSILVNGGQVGSTTDVPAADSYAANSGTSFTTNFMVNPGSPVNVEVRGDIFDSAGTDDIAAGTITSAQAVLVAKTGNAVPQVSLGTIPVPSATVNVNGNAVTISSGSIGLVKTSTYGDQTVVSPTTAYKIGSFVLNGNSTEAVNLNTIYVAFSASESGTPATDLSNLYVVYGGTQSAIKGTVAGSADPSLANSWSINRTLAVNESLPIDVYATIASSLSTNTIISTLAVSGTTALSGKTVYVDSDTDATLDTTGFAGQTVTGVTSGTITATQDASSPVSAIVADNQTVNSAAFKVAAVNDSYTVTDLTLTIANATNVTSVNLLNGSTQVATKPGAATVTFSGLNIPVAANSSVVLNVNLVLGTTGVGAGTTGASILTSVSSFKARSSGGTSATGSGTPAGNVMYVYAAIPTVTNVALPTSTLVAGTNTIGKFTVSSNGTGTIGWKKIIFTVKSGTNATIASDTTSTSLWDADTNTQVAGVSTSAGITAGASGTVTFVATNEQQVSGAKTYYLKANVGGSLTTGDTLQVSIGQPSSFVASDDYSTVAGTTATFVWTDQSASGHGEGTNDWNNGFLVQHLPTDTQTLTK